MDNHDDAMPKGLRSKTPGQLQQDSYQAKTQPVIQEIPRTPPKKKPETQAHSPHSSGTTTYSTPRSSIEQGVRGNKGMSLLRYEIKGVEMQYVEINLAPGEAVTGEIEAMMYYEEGIRIKTQMIEKDNIKNTGFLQKLLGLGKSVISGERLFMVTFTNVEKEDQKVAFIAPTPGKIIPLNLDNTGSILCERNSFICSGRRVIISSPTQRDSNAGSNSLNMQKLTGGGMAFVHCGGNVNERQLSKGEILNVGIDTIVAIQSGMTMKMKIVKNSGFAGEPYKIIQLIGPGTVWLQSLPYKKLQQSIYHYTLSRLSGQGLKIKKKRKIWNG